MSASPDTKVDVVARLMRDRHVGSVVVVEGERPVGIVTDRDVAMLIVAEGRDPKTLAVREIMTRDPVTAHVESGLSDAAQIMREHGVRRLPIVDRRGKVIGMLALDDLLALLGEELASLAGAIGHERLREWQEHGGEPPELIADPLDPGDFRADDSGNKEKAA